MHSLDYRASRARGYQPQLPDIRAQEEHQQDEIPKILLPRSPLLPVSCSYGCYLSDQFWLTSCCTMSFAASPPPNADKFGHPKGRIPFPFQRLSTSGMVCSGSALTRRFQPPFNVSVHSVSPRKVKHGTPRK